MARISRIPDNLDQEMMNMVGSGKSAADIQSWLEKKHKLFVSLATVSRKLVKIRKERTEISKAIFANEASKHILSDLDIIQETVELLRTEGNKSMKKGNKIEARQLLDSMGKFIDRRKNMLGIDVEEDTEAAKDEMFDELKSFLDDEKETDEEEQDESPTN